MIHDNAEQKVRLLDPYHSPIRCEACGGTALTFMGVGEYRCNRCKALQYDDYGKARNYIETHKGATAAEIAFATGVEQKVINTMLREERLEITSDSKVFLKCLGCGTEIRSGNYCNICEKIVIAAQNKKLREAEAAERRKNMNMQGLGTGAEAQSGAKRFERK